MRFSSVEECAQSPTSKQLIPRLLLQSLCADLAELAEFVGLEYALVCNGPANQGLEGKTIH